MGYCPDWQRQSMKKTGQSGPTTTSSRKDMGSLFHSAPAAQSKSMTRPMHLADGDTEATYKARGMEASSGDNVGFFERLRMGNIDQEGSEAYNRFGAGRGKEVEAETTRLANRASAAASSRSSDPEPMTAADFQRTDKDTTPVGPRTAGDFQREDKDTTPVSMPRRRATSSVSGSTVKAAPVRVASAPDESSAESRRLSRSREMPDQTGAETSRLARMNAAARPYETRADNLYRRNREDAAASTSRREAERAALRDNVRNRSSEEVDPKTLLPKR